METKILFWSITIKLLFLYPFVTSETVVTVRVNKCCPLRQTFDERTKRCETSTNASNLPRWTLDTYFIDPWTTNNSLILRWKGFEFPKCQYKKLITIHIKQINKTGDSNGIRYFVSNDGNLLELAYKGEDDFIVNHLPQHYCLDPYTGGMVIRVCPPTCDEREPCIRKCCPVGYHYSYRNKEYNCEKSNDMAYTLPLYSHEKPSDNMTSPAQPRFTSGLSSIDYCKNERPLVMSSGWKLANIKTPFKVLTNGTILYYTDKGNKWARLDKPEDYCFDRFHQENAKSQLCRNDVDVLYFCRSKVNMSHGKMSEQRELTWLKNLAYVTLIIAIVSLLLTAIVLFLLIDRVNLHSWTRLSFVTSEFLFLFLFSLIYAKDFQRPGSFPKTCKAFAAIFHFSGLMTMCWLSIINFDLWWTFKVLKPTSARKFDIRRFMYYICFALGLPLLIVSVALIIQSYKPLEQLRPSKKIICRDEAHERIEQAKYRWISPGYGETSCTLSPESLLPYWYGPLCFLLLANLLFFLTTTCRMMSLRRKTRRASIESTGGQMQSNKIFMKIFIVSGVTWNIELIGWLLKIDAKYRLDIVHHLQAMALFYIFICKKGAIRSLQLKYPIIMTIVPLLNSPEVIPPCSRSQRSATLGSISTDASSRNRIGRKLSTASTNSSSVVGESYQRHESFELPCRPTSPQLV